MARMPAVTTTLELPTERPRGVATAADVQPARHIEDDGLAMARGIVFGLAAASICWVLIGLAVWILLKLI
jgi:hypothetical protein